MENGNDTRKPELEIGFAECLRRATSTLHARAERTGFIGDLLNRRADRAGYLLHLRNLAPVYFLMEEGLERHSDTPGARLIARPELFRSAALQSDLSALCGAKWCRDVPLLPAGARYAELVSQAACGNGSRLIAHAYARYLGDLNGGQILKRLLSKSLALRPDSLSFYDFPKLDLGQFKIEYRNAFNAARAEISPNDASKVIEEAEEVFRQNIELSEEINAYLLSAGQGRHPDNI